MLGRPVKWTDDRSDSFLSDSHGRDHEMTAELALDAEGHFLALRLTGYGNLGAYLGKRTTMPPTGNAVQEHDRRLRDAADRGGDQGASSPTPRRSAPIAAPGGPRATTTWSGWSTPPRARWGSTGSSCAGATTSSRSRCRTRRRPACSTTAASSPPCSNKALDARRLGRVRRAQGGEPRRAASCAAAASAIISK